MFPRLTRDLLAAADIVVELATLGEFGIDEHGAPMALEPRAQSMRLAARTRDRCAGHTAHRGATARGRGVAARP